MRLSHSIYSSVAAGLLAAAPVFADGHGAVPHVTPTVGAVHSAPVTPKGTTTHTPTPTKSATTTSTKPATTTTGLNPIAAKITSHPQLDARVTALLPPGMTLNQASAGFKNQGQFIATLHVAHNLNCGPTCFAQLKTDITQKGMSLGQAIQTVTHSSTTTATTRAKAGEREADHDVDMDDVSTRSTKGTSTTSTSSTSSASKVRKTRSDGDRQ